MRRASRAQRMELIAGFISVFALMSLIGAVVAIVKGDPGVTPSLVLLGCVVALGLAFRGYRNAVRAERRE
ncbi:hypothetical protein [Rhodococcus qingshengii]|uniref:hypothetical protein n=1 Tax=Rhodococcus qingshengii TaxID=334542 RepID=UPI00071C395F|nr:hypothetical protein [Rhodococcus qingshengii]KSU68557.1 hypothetical protein AS032_30715 [Rhodococcus qingshengii]MCQ4152255.1 hypothetical protein [Rhodococcus qingshengii]SCC68569.1 hypothetical protein GA0061093_12539 [Rhodococcus qingshengii]